MYVYFYLFTRAGLASLDASVLEAAASLGAGRWRTLRRVVLPLLYPALGGAALLTFMTSLASFSAPYIFGGGFRVMTTQIVATRLNGDDQLAMIETVSLTLVALIALWLLRGSRVFDNAAGGRKGMAPVRVRVQSRNVRLVLGVLGWGLAVLLALAAPDAAPGVVRSAGDLDHGAAASGVHLAQLSDPGGGPGSGAAPAEQPLARHRLDRGGGGDRRWRPGC